MKKVLIAATALGLMAIPVALKAQDDNKKETEEIVIRKKGDKDVNVKVEINGDKIIVNGKPLAEFKDDQVTISKRKMIVRDGDRMMTFNFGDGDNAFNMDDFAGAWGGDSEKEKKAFLGVVTEKVDDGVKIITVTRGSAAEKAGLKKDDIITKLGDDKIDNPDVLADIIGTLKPKDEVTVYYNRNGKADKVKATLGEKKSGNRNMAFSFSGPNGMVRSFTLPKSPVVPAVPTPPGFDEESFNEEMNNYYMPRQKKVGLKLQDTEEGGSVKVIDVAAESTAEKAGVKKDDIITEIDGKKITNTDEAREQLQPEEGKTSYKIKVKRNGKEMDFDVKIPRKIKTVNL